LRQIKTGAQEKRLNLRRCREDVMSDKVYEVAPEWQKRAFIDHAKYDAM
jgi:hypothetical protein